MLRESVKMKDFDHPNVLHLIGVCLDGGPAPYIVLPFMANGSLHCYLRKERPNLLLGKEADEEQVRTHQANKFSVKLFGCWGCLSCTCAVTLHEGVNLSATCRFLQ